MAISQQEIYDELIQRYPDMSQTIREAQRQGHKAQDVVNFLGKLKEGEINVTKEKQSDNPYGLTEEEFRALPWDEKEKLAAGWSEQISKETRDAVTRGFIPGLGKLEDALATEKPKQKLLDPTSESVAEVAGTVGGTFIALNQLSKAVDYGVDLLQAKTFLGNWRATAPLAHILGWGVGGSAYNAIDKMLRNDELPTAKEITHDGLVWAGIEAGLRSAGWTGRFANALWRIGRAKGTSRMGALRQLMPALRDTMKKGLKKGERVLGTAQKMARESEIKAAKVVDIAEQAAIKAETTIPREMPSKVEKLKELPIEQTEQFKEQIKRGKQVPEHIKIPPPKTRDPEKEKFLAEFFGESESNIKGAKERILKLPPLFKDVPLPSSVEAPLSTLRGKIKNLTKDANVIREKGWETAMNYLSKKYGAEAASALKWRKRAKELNLTGDMMEDMIFYRERTANPFRKNDTFKAVEARLPKEAKEFVDKEVTEHMANILKMMNTSPYVKSVKPREFVREIYLPHFFEGDPVKIMKKLESVPQWKSMLKTTNPFANKRSLITYQEAFQKAGLVPKHRNIFDIIEHHERLANKIIGDAQLLADIKSLEKQLGQKLIYRSGDKGYKLIANNPDNLKDYVPFMDSTLRVRQTTRGGKQFNELTDAPALVNKELADSMKGIFDQKGWQPKTIWSTLGQMYDVAANAIRMLRVSLSPFHYVALGESFAGAVGRKALNPKQFWQKAKQWRQDPVFVKRWSEALLGMKTPKFVGRKETLGTVNRLISKLELGGHHASAKVVKGIKAPISRMNRFLWDDFQPNMKVFAAEHYRNLFLKQASKQGIRLSPTQMSAAEKEIAQLVNNQFGGQVWEAQRWLNDPNTTRWLHRLIGYPDWSVSALRQAGGLLKKGALPGTEGKTAEEIIKSLQGKQARNYWIRFGANFFMAQNLMSYIYTGMYNKADGSVEWDWNRAHSTFENEDPSKWYEFQLPDVNFHIMGIKFNPGRDENGRRKYSHFGKQMLEIPRYFTALLPALFSKANPLIQIGWKQLFGWTPGKGRKPFTWDEFTARGVYKHGEYKAWEGKEGLAQLWPRIKEIIKDITPFSVQRIGQGDLAAFPFTVGGGIPTSKGMSIWRAQPYILSGFESGDTKGLKKLQRVLRDNGYEEKSIKSTFSKLSYEQIKYAIEDRDWKTVNKYRNQLLKLGWDRKQLDKNIKRWTEERP
jgi:hypothetical protein